MIYKSKIRGKCSVTAEIRQTHPHHNIVNCYDAEQWAHNLILWVNPKIIFSEGKLITELHEKWIWLGGISIV